MVYMNYVSKVMPAAAIKAPLTPSQNRIQRCPAQQPAPAYRLARLRALAGLTKPRLALVRPAPARSARACACDHAASADCWRTLAATMAARSTQQAIRERLRGSRCADNAGRTASQLVTTQRAGV